MKRFIHRFLYGSLTLAVILTLTSPLRAQDDAAALYKSKCASCHAADGSGNTPIGTKLGVKPVSGPEMVKRSDADWIDATKKGKGKMPAYDGKLTDDQIKSLVTYMRGLAKGK